MRSSFHSTLNAVVGLLDHEQRTGGSPALRDARHRGEERLLARHLLRRLSTGEPHGPWAHHFAYPFRWTCSALRAADHLRSPALHDGRRPDPRVAEAVELIRSARDPDGTWHPQTRHEGRVWFDVDSGVGEPTRGLTLHALRVLAWWDGHAGGGDVSGSCAAAPPASSPDAR